MHPTLARFSEAWRGARDRRRSVCELAAAPPREVRRIAQDVGLNEADLRLLSRRHPGPNQLMPQRLAQLGLDPAYVKSAHRATFQDMERVCGCCRSWRRCARDLAKGDVQTGMSSYCLNAGTIDALTVVGH
jgi:hypothetical protein